MKKAAVILIVLMFIGLSLLSCQKAKEPEGKKEALVQKEEGKQEPLLAEKQKQALQEKKEKPARCQEIWNKIVPIGITREEEKYLREVCRIPRVTTSEEFASVLQWWKDEDGYEEMMYENIRDLADDPRIRSEVIEPLKRIALTSKFPQLRERSVLALHKISTQSFIGKKKFLPLFKEVLRKEIEERGVTKESRRTIVSGAGWVLSEEGEYEYAFPYLMKAKIFKISSGRNDKRALPFMYEVLKDNDDFLKVDTAYWLANMGEKNEEIYSTIIKFVENEDLDAIAIITLGKLGDKRAIPILEKIIAKKGKSYISNEAKNAIEKINRGESKNGHK